MARQAGAADSGNGRGEELQSNGTEPEETANSTDEVLVATATVGVICVGAALFEAALIPGMIIGVCAMLVPKALPNLGAGVESMFRGAVRGTYKLSQKARHVMAEAQEQVQDIVAEENAANAAVKPEP